MAIDVEFQNINENGSGKLFAITSNEHMPIGQLFYKVDNKNKEVDVEYIYVPRKWARQQGIKEQLFAELKASFPRYAVNLNGIKTKQSAFEKESPARSKAQFRYMQGICNGSIEPPEGMTRAKACEFVKHQKDYKELPEKSSTNMRSSWTKQKKAKVYPHNHFSTGEPCECTFTNHWNINRESKWQIISSKLDKIIQENPKVLRTEEGQKVLEWLKTLSEKIDPFIPWIVREYKKQRLVPLNPEDNVTQMIGGPNSPQEFGDFDLDEQTLSHWADWFESKSPTRRGVDIMGLDLQNMAEKISEWDAELADKMEQDANSAKGEVIYKYGPPNEGWTMRNVRPEECREEGDLMGHCVGGYSNNVASGQIKILSLRDPKNKPHATLEVYPDGRVVQIQGKQNVHPIGEYRRMVHEFITQGFERFMGTTPKPDKTVTTWDNIAGELTGNTDPNDIDAILDEDLGGGSDSLLTPSVEDPFDPRYDDPEYRNRNTHPAGYSGYDYNASHYGMDPSQVSLDYGRILRDYPRNLEFFPSSDYQGLGQILYEAAKERGELPIFAKEFEKYNQEKMEDSRHKTENHLFPSFEEGPDWTVERGKEGGWRDIFEKATGRIDPSLIYPLNSPEYKEAMLDYKRGWNDWVRSNFTGQQTWPGLGDEQGDLEEPYAVREDRANRKREFFDLANRNTIENLLNQHRNNLGEYSNEEVNPLQRDKRGRPIIPNLDQMVINRSLVDNDESKNKVHPEQMALFSKWKISKPSLVPPDAVRSAARRGIKYHAEGKAGDGFEDATLDRAHKIANGEELTPEHVKRMHSFFERHAGGRSQKAKEGEVTPWDVAWLAWGGNAGRSWASSKVKELEKTSKKECNCWDGYKRVPGTKPCAPGSCEKCDSARNKKSKWKKKADWVTTDGDKKKELDPYLIESALNSYKESDVYDYYKMGFRRGIREVQSRLRGDSERGTMRQMTFDLSQSLMTKDEESEIRYELSHNLSRFNPSLSEERILLDTVMDKIFWPWFKKGRQDAVEKTMHLPAPARVNLWYKSDELNRMIIDGFIKEYRGKKSSKWKIAAKDPSTLTEDEIITLEWANGKRIHVMWSGFFHAFDSAYSRGQVNVSNPQQETPYVKTRWNKNPPERKTPDQIIMPLINDIANMGQGEDWYTGDASIRNKFNFQTGITPSKFWGKGRKYTEEGKQFSKSNFIKMLVQDFNVFYKEGWKAGLYFGAQDYYDNNNKTRNEYIQEERKKLHEDQNYTYENYRDVAIKYMKETKEEAKKWFMEKLKEYDPDIISYVDITRLSSVKNSYFEEFNTESGSNEYGDHLLIKDPETDETIGSVYYALAPDGNGTMVYYIGYGDKLHPANDAEEVSDIKSRYPRIGVEIFKWVRNNLPEPYYAAFANQDLKRVLRAEPTGMHSYDMVTGEPVSVDIIRRSKVERYIKKSDQNSPTMTEEQLLNAVKLHGFVKGIDAAEKYFSYGPFPEEERMPKDQIFLFHYEDPQKIKDWYHQTNSRDLSAFYDYIKYIKDSVTDIAPKIDDAYITWFDQGVNYSIKNQANKKNWPLDRISPQEAAHIFFEQLNKTAALYDNNDDDDFEDIPYGYLSIDDVLDHYLTDADIERMKNIGLALGIKKALKILQKEQDRPYFKVPREQTTMSLDFIAPPTEIDIDTPTYMRMRDTAIDILFNIQRVSQKEVFNRISIAVELTNNYSVPYFSVGFNEINNLYKTNPQKIKEINPNDINSIYDFVEENLIAESKTSKWKIAKKDAWEAVLDGELGHDIITTGTWEEVKKQIIKWLKQLENGYINKKNPHDNKKIDSEAKKQDSHALEDLKLYKEKKRWSFHFDHGKHPYDLIIQPVGYKESKWNIAGDKNIREVMKEWQRAVEDGDVEKEKQMEKKFWALRGMKKEFVEKYGPSDVRRLGKIKTSEDGYWSTPQTELVMELINSSPLTFRGGPSVKLDKIVRRGGSVQDVANFAIQNFVIPYNEDLQWRWQETNDEEDVAWQKREHRKEWKQQARKQFPLSIPKQRQYVREMEQMQYGLLGDPTPYKLEDYIIDVSKIDWNQIYNVIRNSLRTSKWKKTSASPFVMQVLEKHDNGQSIDQIAKTLKTAPREVSRIVKSDLRQRSYEGLDRIQQYEKALMHKDEAKAQEIENKIWEEAGYVGEYDESADFYELLRQAIKRGDSAKYHQLMKQFWTEHGNLGEEYDQDISNSPSQDEMNTWMQEELNKIPKQ
jgi:hypothetical protein